MKLAKPLFLLFTFSTPKKTQTLTHKVFAWRTIKLHSSVGKLQSVLCHIWSLSLTYWMIFISKFFHHLQILDFSQRFGAPNFLEFKVPLPTPFHFILINKFRVLGPGNSFEIFLKFSKKFRNFFKNGKPIIIVSKLVRNHHIDQNLAKFSPTTSHQKIQFFPKKLHSF